jgi:hypothetical protein
MISFIDIKNSTLVKKLLQIEKTCHLTECKKKSCNMGTAMTHTIAIVAEEFSLKMTVTSRPWIQVMSSPSLNLVEFLTYIMSVVSTWTGLSIMSFLPAKIAKELKNKNNCPDPRIADLMGQRNHHPCRSGSDKRVLISKFALPPIA